MSDITANVVVSMPSQLFTLARSFKAAANGKIYIGQIDTDPTIPSNQIQVYIENEDGEHVPTTQPININAGGYPVYNGNITKFVTVQGHSMAVYDAYGTQQFYFPNILKYDPDQLEQRLASSDGLKYIGMCPDIATLRTIEPTIEGQRIILKQHTAGTGLGGGTFRAVLSGASYTDNNGTIIKTTGGAAWLRLNAEVVNPLMFGALGDGVTNDVVAINRAIASASKTDLLGRTYLISGGNFEVYNTGRCEVYNGTITEPAVSNNVMMRISGSNKVVRDITFLGDTGLISRGIIVSAGASSVLIQRCTFMNMKKPAIGISGDYTNNIYCKDITIDTIYAENCGNDATNFDRNTILFDGVSNCSVINSTLNNCNWGVSFRQPYTYPALTERYANYNSVINCRISGKGFTGNPYPENQGISSQSQRHFKVSGCIIESFSGNAVDHQRCDYGRFENNRISGSSDGLFFGDLTFRGHVVIGNTFSSCVRALRVYSVPDFKNQTMTGLVFSNNVITDCSYFGIYLSSTEPTNTFAGFSIKDNVIDNAGSVSLTTFQNPILIEGVTTSEVSGNIVRYARKEGLRFNSCNTIAAYGNTISFFDASVTTQPGIYIDVNSRGVMLRNSIVTTSSGTGAAVRNVSTNSTITGTRWNGVTSGINDTGVATVVADNVAF
ncbi:hypothetical protein A3464_18940 [Enterobacter genomosp. O]|uniref:phage tailspike protein n=1 Tax=Enterobacter genomosp. O TaxID=2364150 RepID=UPI0007B34F77|nr:phage tailspike protein [Enterobacter genomosp. O]KZQ38555.1 hypothetical protein A3464_18940 [Enterobacter genomosp. O]